MKLNTLEYFITLAESRSINEAAKKLYISQPSLTKALQLLEEEIGVQLFQRSSAGIILTPAGKRILPEAKQVVEYYRGWKTLSQPPALEKVSIYSYFSFPDFLFPELLIQFRMSHPELDISYQTTAMPENHISCAITRPVISLVVCRDQASIDRLTKIQGNQPIILTRGEYRCLVNKDHPLARKESVSPEDLRDYFMITPNLEDNNSSGYISGILQAIAEANPGSRNICVESATNVINIVRKNTRAYALSHYPTLKRYHSDQLVDIPFRGIDPQATLCLFYSREACEQHPVMRELIDAIQRNAEQFFRDAT